MEKSYTFKITAADEKQCVEKMQAASDLVKNLKHADLIMLAKAVKTNPGLIEQARPFLS